MIERFYAALTDGGLVNGALSGMMTAQGALAPGDHRVRERLHGFPQRSQDWLTPRLSPRARFDPG
jgi:hypothetical protein